MRKIVILILFALTLLSCGRADLTVLVDPWWEDAWDRNGILKNKVRIEGLKKFQNISYINVNSKEEALDVLNSLAKSPIEQRLIITPVFFKYVNEFSLDEKNINYILLNGFYDDPADNVIAVYSYREEVYRKAGAIAGRFSDKAGNSAVAAVFYDNSESRRRERESFIEGFYEENEKGELLTFSQVTYSGGEKLKSFITSAPSRNVGLFFFSASSLNAFCVEQALPLSIPISGENLTGLAKYNELIEFSVDDDMMEIIETAIKIGLDGEIENDFPIPPVIRKKGIHF